MKFRPGSLHRFGAALGGRPFFLGRGEDGAGSGAAARGGVLARALALAVAGAVSGSALAGTPGAAAGTSGSTAGSPGATTGDGAAGWTLIARTGSADVSVLECSSGRTLASHRFDSPLSALVSVAADGRSAFAATGDRALWRLELPALRPSARATLPAAATVVAGASGPDAIVLAGSSGLEPLSAHAAVTLETLQRYRLEAPASVSALLDLPQRRRIAVGFGDLAQVWEIAYDRDAPPVLKGLIHDYGSREWVPLPGRLTARPFEVPSPTRWLAPGGAAFEIARGDSSGRFGVVNLDVRREIERPALGGDGPPRVAAWKAAAGRGWVAADRSAGGLAVLHAPSWRIVEGPALAAPVVAVATLRGNASDVVVALHAAPGGWAMSAVDPVARTRREVGRIAAEPGASPVLAASADRRCAAVLDEAGRWFAAWIPAEERFATAPVAGR